MGIPTRTPEGLPNRCPTCGAEVRVEPSAGGDAPCPHCGALLWFAPKRWPPSPREALAFAGGACLTLVAIGLAVWALTLGQYEAGLLVVVAFIFWGRPLVLLGRWLGATLVRWYIG